jgi:hypothetical protein
MCVSSGPHRPAAIKTIMPGHRVLAAPMRDIKADWKGLELGGANQCGQHHRDINHRLRIELVEAFAG